MADIRIIPSTGLVNVTGSINFKGTGGSTMLFMTGSSGYVGLGTASPAGWARLSLAGNLYVKTTAPGSWNDGLVLDRTGTAWNAIIWSTDGSNSSSGDYFLGHRSGTSNLILMGNLISNTGTSITAPRADAAWELKGGETGDKYEIYVPTAFGQNVGIGTASPDNRLHVYGGRIVLDNIAGAQSAIQFNSAGTEVAVLYRPTSTTDIRLYNPTAGDLMTWAGGNVGIGSTSPGKTLDVVGAIRASTAVSASAGIHIKSDGSADSSWDALTFRGTTEWGDASAYGVLGGDASEGIMLRRPHIVWSSVQSDAAIRLGRSGGTSGGDWFGVGVAASNVFFIRRTTTTNSILEVDTNGNMALGAGSDYLYVRQGGNVGVGTTNPSNKLQVVGGVTATSFTGSLLGNATSASFASTAPYSGLTGTVPTWNQNTTGTADYATYLYSRDIRAIAPNDETSGTARFGFTSWGNNNTSPWADFLHLRSYTDATGGSDNLIMFLKSGIGMRIWQQSWNSGTDYSSYKDVAFTDSNITGNAATATTASFATTAATAATATSATSATTATTAATASSANDFYVRGSLGVGTASPSYKLDVSGQIRVNNGVGNGSGQALIVGGSGDVTLTDGGSLFFGAYDYGGSTYIRGYDGGDIMYFYTNGTNMGYFRSDRAYFAVNTGIGTSSPSTRLHVSGGDAILRNAYIGEVPTYTAANAQFSHISRAGAGEYSFLSANDGETFINSKTGYNINFRVNNSNVAIITSAGNIGIGTTNPSYKLDVEGSVNGELRAASFVNSNTGTSAYNEINLVANDATLRLGVTNTNYPGQWTGGGAYFLAPGGMFFGPGNDYKLSVLANGNVGIGTTSPGGILDVQASNAGVHLARIWNTNTAGTGASVLRIANSGNNNNGNRIEFTDQQYYTATISGDRTQGIVFRTSATGGDPIAIDERMRITPGGLVGIGVTSPINGSKFEVRGSGVWDGGVITLTNTGTGGRSWSIFSTNNTFGQGGDRLLVYNTTAGTNAMVIDSSNNVGIGVTDPGFKLDVGGTFQAQGNATFNGSNTYINSDNTVVGNNTTDIVGISGNTMYFPGTGNVGIGTTTPSQKLHVNGSAYLQSGNLFLTQGNYITWNSGDNYIKGISGYHLQFTTYDGSAAQVEVLRLTGGTAASGGARVGIGTSVPIAKLHVSGSSGSLAFNVEGSQGQLFSVTDSLSGSLMSVNDISGLPILEVFSDDRVIGGKFGSNALSISGSNVGIGAYNPARKLDVYDAASQIVAQFSSSNATSVRIKFSDANTGAENVNIGAIGTRMALWTNNTERVSILSGGNVGINTTSPGAQLEVYKASDAFISVRTGGGSYSYLQLATPSSDNGYIIKNTATGNSALDKSLYLWNGTGPIQFVPNGTIGNAVTIDTSGNIGIGSTSPAFKLDVNGGIRTLTGYIQGANSSADITIDGNIGTLLRYGTQKLLLNSSNAILYTADAIRLFIDNAGLIGIGTTSPTQLLHIQGANAGNNGISLQNTNASGNSQVRFLNTSGTERAAITYINSADAVYHYTAGGGNLFNLVGGNVGIGTATPAVLLHLYGSGNTFTRYTNTSNSGHYVDIGANSAGESFIYGYGAYPVLFGTNGSEKMRILSNGNVGIGTTAPITKLHVAGQTYMYNGASNALYINTDVADNNTRDAIYLYEASGQATGRQAISWYNGNGGGGSYYKARLWTQVGSSYVATVFGIDVANDAQVVDTRLAIRNGNVGIGTTTPTHLLHVSGGGIRIQGTGNAANSLRFDDTGGTSRNAMYVSSSNYLVVGNSNYAGLQLIHTGSAPTINDGSAITQYYGTEERIYLSEPNNWLAVRINNTNFVIPMYQV